MTTLRMKNAVHFCENHLQVKFDGNINSVSDVSNFLDEYYDNAMEIANDAKGFYNTFIEGED